MPWSSNATFLVTVCLDGEALDAVYKPHRGERPLWDFPGGLYQREVAAYRVSEAIGWRVVPETVVRDDAPLGVGSLQRFVEADFEQHYFTLMEDERHHDRLRVIAALDVVMNNADRKSGHCLIDQDGHIWGIDNGLCFHEAPKLRTVIWEFAGDPLPSAVLEATAALADDLPELDDLLTRGEIHAIRTRARRLCDEGVLPEPDPGRRPYPWPLV